MDFWFFFTQMDDTDHSEYKVVLALTQKTDRFFITFTHNAYAGIKHKHERNNLGVWFGILQRNLSSCKK